MKHRAVKLTHLNEKGEAHMVDVSNKPVTLREASAVARVFMKATTLSLIAEGEIAKGDVFGTARIAAIMAAKKTPEIVPLCHPIALNSVEVDIKPNKKGSSVDIVVTTRTAGPTGVEMEAMVGAGAGALTVYDMCKALDRGMRISDLMLIEKKGGKSGHWKRD